MSAATGFQDADFALRVAALLRAAAVDPAIRAGLQRAMLAAAKRIETAVRTAQKGEVG